ncbi:hypothetical protein NPIL_469511 [Nephila pilipes]|uniref:Uncharacterized protein n=1 Tax=Nephila pilipes TaxID=299642 RepID=A0A8X6TGQ3_NEPPI|nr:hypothetical protein NPIL_469511 [Nephila pilipes]
MNPSVGTPREEGGVLMTTYILVVNVGHKSDKGLSTNITKGRTLSPAAHITGTPDTDTPLGPIHAPKKKRRDPALAI